MLEMVRFHLSRDSSLANIPMMSIYGGQAGENSLPPPDCPKCFYDYLVVFASFTFFLSQKTRSSDVCGVIIANANDN